MLAYVFWHWKRPDTPADEYEARQRDFHAALRSSPPDGFDSSFTAAVAGAPWAASPDAYEDWYLVRDFTSLGVLNDAAVSHARKQPHDRAAAVAAGGTAGLYGLRLGTPLPRPTHALWFAKPDGLSYHDLHARLEPIVAAAHGALWMRQMVLGPAREFCLHSATPVTLPPEWTTLPLSLRPLWPD